MKSAKKAYSYKCLDHSRSRVPRHTKLNEILAHTLIISNGCVLSDPQTCICTFADFAYHSYQQNIFEMFLYLVH